MQLNVEINILNLEQKLNVSKNPLNRHPENAKPAQWGWLHKREFKRSHKFKKSGMQHADREEMSQEIYHMVLGKLQQQTTGTAFICCGVW